MSLRQLASLYPAQSTNSVPDIGNEGFKDVINAASAMLGRRPKKKDINQLFDRNDTVRNKASRDIKMILDKFYGNPTWVKKQTLVVDDISAKGIFDHVVMDGKVEEDLFKNFDVAEQKLGKFFSTYTTTMSAVARDIRSIDKDLRIHFLNEYNHGDGSKLDTIVEEATERQQKAIVPLQKLPTLPGTSLGNRVLEIKRTAPVPDLAAVVKSNPPTVEKIKPLTADQILKASDLIERITSARYAGINAFSDAWARLGVDHSDGSKFNDIFEAGRYGSDEYYAVASHHAFFDLIFMTDLLDSATHVKALYTWIERSIA